MSDYDTLMKKFERADNLTEEDINSILQSLSNNPAINAGETPPLDQNRGTNGPEHKFRDRFYFLRTLPLPTGECILLLDREYPVYEPKINGKTKRSNDLLGVRWGQHDLTKKVAAIELKWDSNTPLYALLEVARNCILLSISKKRLEDSWKITQEKCFKHFTKRNIFSKICPENTSGIILGPMKWYEDHSDQKEVCLDLAQRMTKRLGISFEFIAPIEKEVRPTSSPTQLLPLINIW